MPEHALRVDVHAHPGRCFLAGLTEHDQLRAVLGPDTSDDGIGAAIEAGMAAVAFATVADLRVIGPRGEGLGAVREFSPGECYSDHRRQLAAITDTATRCAVPIVRTAADIEAAHAASTTALFVTCEGADFVEHDLARVAEAHRDGVRSITVVHYRQNEFGDLQTEPPRFGGLSGPGRDLVVEMNRLGMVVDLAHASFATTADAVEVSSQPVMISHTHLAGPKSDHPRLVTDEHASVVAEAGGLIGAWPSGVASEALDDFIDEIARLVTLVGVSHVAIGTDLDANYRPVLTEYSQFDDLAAGLMARGFGSAEVARVLGGNAVDLIRTVCG